MTRELLDLAVRALWGVAGFEVGYWAVLVYREKKGTL